MATALTDWINPPQQERSRAVLDRILDATEQLLDERTFEEIGVADIVQRAECSTGSFYARVRKKEGLLWLLQERLFDDMRERVPELLAPARWDSASLADMVAGITAEGVRMHRERRGLIRASIVMASTDPTFRDQTRRFQGIVMDQVLALWLTRRESITHGHPERAARYAFLTAVGLLREAVIFAPLWPAQDGCDDGEIAAEIARIVTAALCSFPNLGEQAP